MCCDGRESDSKSVNGEGERDVSAVDSKGIKASVVAPSSIVDISVDMFADSKFNSVI